MYRYPAICNGNTGEVFIKIFNMFNRYFYVRLLKVTSPSLNCIIYNHLYYRDVDFFIYIISWSIYG